MQTTNDSGKTLLGYQLTNRQNAIVNHLVPSLFMFTLYAFQFTSELLVVFRHYKDNNPIWASIVIFVMYAPVLGCFILTVSDVDLWPKEKGFGSDNIVWLLRQIMQHAFYPIWTVWRFAERIFWSIEATRSATNSTDDKNDDYNYTMTQLCAPRTIELYLFLQAFIAGIPQIFLQLHLVMIQSATITIGGGNSYNLHPDTLKAQLACITLNLCKLSITTTQYQRYKAHQMTGVQYPWLKTTKKQHKFKHTSIDCVDYGGLLRNRQNFIPIAELDTYIAVRKSQIRRRSSDYYESPVGEADGILGRVTSLLDKTRHKPQIQRKTQINSDSGGGGTDEVDFNLTRLRYIRGLPVDDAAGKLVASSWWFCFLLARFLALSTFVYFKCTLALCFMLVHVLIVIICLVFDVRNDDVLIKRGKVFHFLFVGLIYLFCIVEFKVKFRRAKFIYYGFFSVVFAENFAMCLWWFLGDQLDELESDYWFRYIFYVIVACSVFSLFSMAFYFSVNKPKKVVIGALIG